MRMLIPLSEACEKYDKSDDGFYSSAFLFKKENGAYPDWYVQNGDGDVFIDVFHYEKWVILERKAWLMATDNLYFLLNHDYGCTDWSIAKFMASHSRKYTNIASWSSFISKALFSLPRKSILQKRVSMTMEFVLIGSYMLRILMQEEQSNAVQ